MSEWKTIDSAPRDEVIDTYGYWINKRTTYQKYIRNCDDFISKHTVNPLTCTYFEHEGVTGTYTRTHWMPVPETPLLPQPPAAKE